MNLTEEIKEINIFELFHLYVSRLISSNSFCKTCNENRYGELVKSPKYLILKVNRVNRFGNKVQSLLHTPIYEKYRKFNYKLVALSSHTGKSSQAGHWIAYRYINHRLYKFSDMKVEEDSPNEREICLAIYEEINDEEYCK